MPYHPEGACLAVTGEEERDHQQVRLEATGRDDVQRGG